MSKELAITKTVSPVVAKAELIKITDSKSMEKAIDFRTEIKTLYKKIIDKRKSLTDPIKDQIKVIEADYKPYEKILEEAIEKINTNISAYQTAEMKRVKAEADAIANRVGEGKGHLKPETAVAKIEAIEKAPSQVGATKFKNVPELVITDENAIPREYLVIDTVKLRRDLLAGKTIKGAEMQDRMIPVGF